MLQVGEKAPEFAISAHDGSEIKLSDHPGKSVVLWFYPAADTGG